MPATMKIGLTALYARTQISCMMKKLIDVTAQVDLSGMKSRILVYLVLILHANGALYKISGAALSVKVSQSLTTLTIVSVLSTTQCQLLKDASQSFTSPAVASTLSSARPVLVRNAILAVTLVWALILTSV